MGATGGEVLPWYPAYLEFEIACSCGLVDYLISNRTFSSLAGLAYSMLNMRELVIHTAI